ncbi:MAG: PQQ-binding-like beta-propeller repeat protein [Phycisphaerae bacterium]|nr:PQQ-binding-like beta-propeller repeat protein [Phycisphaerae bacterium]
MRKRLSSFNPALATTAVLLLLAATAPLSAQEWARFRGPNGTGISSATTIPTSWKDDTYNWKLNLPGEGHSSPVLWGSKLFLTATQPGTAEQIFFCVNADSGKVVWQKRFASRPHRQHKFNSFASSSPAADENHVYFYWATPQQQTILALDHDGKEIWRKNLGPFESQHGSGTSPMIHGELLILANDQMGSSFVIALDRMTGAVKWKTPRGGGGKKTAYGTPCVRKDAQGNDQLILASHAHGISAIDPATGKMLWDTPDIFDKRSVFCPVLAGDLILASCGSGGGARNYTVALRANPKPTVAYRIDRSSPYVPTPIYYKKMLFLVSDGGIGTCLEAASGKVLWRERIGGDYFGSPVCVNGVIYCISRAGDVVTFHAKSTYEPIGRVSLGEMSHATPAVAGGRMYLRTKSHLYSLGGK